MSRLLAELPPNAKPVRDYAELGDFYRWKDRFVQIEEGSPFVGAHPQRLPNQTLYRILEPELHTVVPISLTAALLHRAREMVEYYGMEELRNYRHEPRACACMGPQDDEPVCPCKMRAALERELPHIIALIEAEK